MSAIYLVRHGQASFSGTDYDALSALGERQAQILGAAFAHRGLQVAGAVCGGMQRHRQTATACLSAMGASVALDIDARWNEYDHNDLLAAVDTRWRNQHVLARDLLAQGDPGAAFRKVFGLAIRRWVGGAHDGDYRETWVAFQARVQAALAAVEARLKPHETVLVFTSGGPISMVCRDLLGLNDERTWALNLRVVNTAVTRVVRSHGALEFAGFNAHTHLEEAQAVQGEPLVTYV